MLLSFPQKVRTVEKCKSITGPAAFIGTRVKVSTRSTALKSKTVQLCIATSKQLSKELFQKRCQETWNSKAGTVRKMEGQSNKSKKQLTPINYYQRVVTHVFI